LGKTVKSTVKHRSAGLNDTRTYCGKYVPRYSPTTIRLNKTWKGVTCQKCLAVKAKEDRNKAAIKANKKVGV
jgi:hypothetical protein